MINKRNSHLLLSKSPVSLFLASSVLAFSALPSSAYAEAADLFSTDLFSQGTTKFNFRLRHEAIDQDGIARDASSSTLRSRFTWNSNKEHKLKLGLEADYISIIGSENFNSTENGNTQYPVVPDPEGFDLNQAFVKYVSDSTTYTFGRQRILHEGQRFIGGVGWRQNEQTFDALRVETSLAEVKIDYSYLWNVNRIFGPDDGAQPADWHGNSHLLNVSLYEADQHKVNGYAYLLDFENDNGPVNSTATYGVSYAGKFQKLTLTAGYASQSDYQDSPLDYRADYWEASVAYQFSKMTLKAGMEVLASDDGVSGFKTPLATLHKFQGWADVFLNTPVNGIEDQYVAINGSVKGIKLALAYHQFDAEQGSADYGSELNLVGTYKLSKPVTVQLKFADYDAEDFATDRQKLWLSFIYQP